jgi:hypothetical protein
MKSKAITMKNLIFILSVLFSGLLFNQNALAQEDYWSIRAIEDNGNFLEIKAIDQAGNMLDIIGVNRADGNQFMDVKALEGTELLAVKMLISNDYYVPVKALGKGGEIYDVKAITSDGTKLDVKGVSRAGNTIVMAAITANEKFINIKAISPDGRSREVRGIKFEEENLELELMGIKILAHIKAVPTPKVNTNELVWNIKAIDTDGNAMPVYAIGKKDKEYGVKALVQGSSYHLLDVKAIANWNELSIKLLKKDGMISLAAIDEMGNVLPVLAKTDEGKYLIIEGYSENGKLFDIKAIGPEGAKYAVKAISSSGDIYDVKGVKAKDRDEEGEILGIKYALFFHAHVKAFPPVN